MDSPSPVSVECDGVEILAGYMASSLVAKWVESSLNLHWGAYVLTTCTGAQQWIKIRRELCKTHAFKLTMNQNLAVVLRPDGADELKSFRACRDCLGHAPLGCLDNRAVLPELTEDLWLHLAMALASLAPDITRTISTLRQFEGARLGFDDDDGPDSLLIGELTFHSDDGMTFSIQIGMNQVTISAVLPLSSGLTPLAAIWHAGAVDWSSKRIPEIREMSVMSADVDACQLREMLQSSRVIAGTSTFRATDYPLVRVERGVKLLFVRAADKLKWLDLGDK